MTEKPVRAAFTIVLAALLLTACSGTGEPASQESPSVRTVPSVRTAPSARTIAFQLYTHCGIDEARIGSTYFEAETPLSDGSAGPPDGWDNPYQRGRMTLTSATRAVFTDDAGHEVVFRARPDAKAFKVICQ
ncbi:hypothetical protein ACFWU3_23285 [Streptomyces sp. NPDC058685]|uniref:hypothetical protein n=1 Tax=Streptomyces sp. NPDC058685 TaxID=3346598 RepID=UPI0036620E01